MPYKSERTEERERWMTLPEAIRQICIAEQWTEQKAQQHLRFALADKLGLARWEEEEPREEQKRRKANGNINPVPFLPGRMATPYSDPPPSGSQWMHADVNWQDGTVRNILTAYKTGLWRVVLVHRAALAALYEPIADHTDPTMIDDTGPSAASLRSPKKEKSNVSSVQVRAEMRKYIAHEENSGRAPNQKRALAWFNRELPSAKTAHVIMEMPKKRPGRPKKVKSAP